MTTKLEEWAEYNPLGDEIDDLIREKRIEGAHKLLEVARGFIKPPISNLWMSSKHYLLGWKEGREQLVEQLAKFCEGEE